MQRQIMGLPPEPFIPPAGFGQVIPPGIPTGFSSTGESARRVVDTLVGTPKPISVQDAFGVVFAKLGTADGANNDLIDDLEMLRRRIVARLDEQKQGRRAALEAERERLCVECREKLDRVRALRVEFNSWGARINALGEHVSKHRAEASGIRENAPRPEDYPTPAEMQAWCDSVQQAESALAEWEQRQQGAENERERVRLELQSAIDQFQAAEQAEQRVAARLEGRRFADPAAFGVITEPEEL